MKVDYDLIIHKSKSLMSEITESNIDSTWEFTRKLTEDCFPRLTGTPGCIKAGELIKNTLEEKCDHVVVQEFTHRPTGFLKFLPFSGGFHIIAIILLLMNYTIFALGMFFLNAFIFVSQLLFYWGLFDFPFKKEEGRNIIGTIEPTDEPKQQIIFSGHYDAPYVFQLLDKIPKWYPIIFGIALFSVLLAFFGTLIFQIFIFFGDYSESGTVFVFYKFILVFLSISTFSFFIFTTNEISPGAGDNAIAVGLIMEMANIFTQEEYRLSNTRLIITALDAEEAGLNGARAYVNKYKKNLLSLPTFNFNIDSIYNKEHIALFVRDLNSIRKLSIIEAKLIQDIGKELGNDIALSKMPIGGGSTDSAEFARIGVDSIALFGLDLETIGHKTSYHSSRDTMDALSKDSIELVLNLMKLYAVKKDNLT